ncbi:hypothetical protein AAVH_19531 [Aphelenchoides avenae]|nr:hypothetical protein AAVH_19531 [Aphelenchus avenae]
MSMLPLESVEEWMAYLNRETIDACVPLCRNFRDASSSMVALRFVDTAHLIEYETVQNYNVTIAWTTVTRSRRGKPKTEKKSLKINCENAVEAIALFSAALRFCVVKERIDVHMRSLLLHRTDLDQLSEPMQELLKDAKIAVDQVRFGHLDDYNAASALLSTLDVDFYYFTSSALSIDLLKWADANEMYGGRPRVVWNENALTEEMILYRCFGGQSTKRFTSLGYARVHRSCLLSRGINTADRPTPARDVCALYFQQQLSRRLSQAQLDRRFAAVAFKERYSACAAVYASPVCAGSCAAIYHGEC